MAFDVTRSASPRPGRIVAFALLVVFALILLTQGPFRTVPAGHVGVKDFFGSVSSDALGPGIHVVFPLTRVERMSVQTQEIKEVAEVPSKEGLILNLETSLLFQLDRPRLPTSTRRWANYISRRSSSRSSGRRFARSRRLMRPRRCTPQSASGSPARS